MKVSWLKKTFETTLSDDISHQPRLIVQLPSIFLTVFKPWYCKFVWIHTYLMSLFKRRHLCIHRALKLFFTTMYTWEKWHLARLLTIWLPIKSKNKLTSAKRIWPNLLKKSGAYVISWLKTRASFILDLSSLKKVTLYGFQATKRQQIWFGAVTLKT